MAEADRVHWDSRYQARPSDERTTVDGALPAHFAPFAERFGQAATAVEIACGVGAFAIWLALRGVSIVGYDVSPVAISQADANADRAGVRDRCRFEAVDLDGGLPPGQPVDLIVCNLFRDPVLDDAMISRLVPGGVIAIAALSEVGAEPGRFRVKPGELPAAFAELTMLGADEGDGLAWFVGERSG